MKHKNNLGFTMIELLVVIALIALLASIIMVSVQRSRISARNADRKQTTSSIRKALEAYSTNTPNGGYPNGDSMPNTDTSYDAGLLASVLVPNFLTGSPLDPLCPAGGACNYRYAWSSIGGAYSFLVRFGNETGGTDCQWRVNNISANIFLDANNNPVPDCSY